VILENITRWRTGDLHSLIADTVNELGTKADTNLLIACVSWSGSPNVFSVRFCPGQNYAEIKIPSPDRFDLHAVERLAAVARGEGPVMPTALVRHLVCSLGELLLKRSGYHTSNWHQLPALGRLTDAGAAIANRNPIRSHKRAQKAVASQYYEARARLEEEKLRRLREVYNEASERLLKRVAALRRRAGKQ
jgi:hypothetical protein